MISTGFGSRLITNFGVVGGVITSPDFSPRVIVVEFGCGVGGGICFCVWDVFDGPVSPGGAGFPSASGPFVVGA